MALILRAYFVNDVIFIEPEGVGEGEEKKSGR